ncbi:PAS domain-containing sensor histidine kinase, partial [Mesorhizobium sp. M2C.T.Ca.TU.002.02.1.1]
MVHPTVTGEAERLRQRRFIGVMLAAPFLAAGAAVTLVTSSLGAAVTMAAIFAAFGLCWFAALLVAATGHMALAGRMAVMLGGLALAGAVAAAGGLASPAALLAIALPVETLWVSGSRRAALAGALAALAAIALQPFVGQFLPLGEIAAWHWLLPLAWALTLLPRAAAFANPAGSQLTEPGG